MSKMSDEETAEEFINEFRHPDERHERVMEIYKTWAPDYDRQVGTPDYVCPRKVAQLAAEVLAGQKDTRVLDLGAGTGLSGEELKKSGFDNVDALDASEEMLNVAKEREIYKYYIHDILGPNRLDIEDDTYDVATISGCFVPGHADGSCLKEIVRILKPGGYFIGSVGEHYLTTCERLKDLEPAMQRLEDAGMWKRLVRRVELYRDHLNGVYFAFQVLAK